MELNEFENIMDEKILNAINECVEIAEANKIDAIGVTSCVLSASVKCIAASVKASNLNEKDAKELVVKVMNDVFACYDNL